VSADQPLTADELATIKASALGASGVGWWEQSDRHDLRNAIGAHFLGNVDTAEDDARHIITMDPATTLRLVAEIERLQAEKSAILGQSEQAYRLLRISGDLGPAATLLAQMKRWPEFVESP
jgi:hypothetical protein